METVKGVPDVGRGGYFGTSHYPELAHFLVVRKMLSRFRTVHYFMDCSEELYATALTALAPDIKNERAEIVLFQHKKDPADAEIEERDEEVDSKSRKKAKEGNLDIAWDNRCANFNMRVRRDMFPDEPEIYRQRVAKELKSALYGAYSDPGQWAWLRYPPTNQHYTDPRTLWLTWTPDKNYETQGREMLMGATLQPIDTICNSMRAGIAGFQRPTLRAKPGRGYRNSYFLPRVLCAEIWIMLLWFNYGVRF